MSRRKGRYERRLEKRKAKKEKLKQYDNFDNVAGIGPLYVATKKACKGVSWKASVQRALLSILLKAARNKKDLYLGKDMRQGFIEFDLNERGKPRHISSVHINERIIQKTMCINALYPTLTNSVIYDNYASQKGKGTHFAEERFVKYLRWHYKRYGRKGYVLLIDFKGYFDSIPHAPLKENFRHNFTDKRIIKLADDFVDAFGERGLGLGSETSQINAIVHINKIDHYIKEKERVKCYGRYMDDSFIIHPDYEYLQNLLQRLEIMYSQYGVVINKKKSKIVDLKHGFTFLKTRFYLTETGKVIKKPCRESITRERRKLNKQAKLVREGIIDNAAVLQSYNSWRGSMEHRNARKTIYSMDQLYQKLFIKE